LKIIGVTGTDGKTTTSTMIYEILEKAGYKVGLLTSVSGKIGKKEFDTGFHVTTPDPWLIPKYLRMMIEAGLEWVVLEVTSHALDQNRVANINFEKAIFTNITDEHLDYHKTWKALAIAKAKLISMVKEGVEVIYKEDERGGKFIEKKIEQSKSVVMPVVCKDELAKKVEVTREGIKFNYKIKKEEHEVLIPIIGEYNIANAQCAIKATEGLVKGEKIVSALSGFKGIKGRMQIVRRKRPCLTIVDFAHTSNAMRRALQTLRKLQGKGRIIVVFGCAGLRDRKKRPRMGKISAKLAKVVIITAEDPRVEKLSKINDQILKGAYESKGRLIKRFVTRKAFRKASLEKIKSKLEKRRTKKGASIFVFDKESVKGREDAIELAVKLAEPNDIIVATGKGHEKSLCFGKVEYPWSDVEAVRRAIRVRYGGDKKSQMTNYK
jgi:UDP-N-acetylmuramoyl-L-alanyl-D-glutamate--2,6-diaminopimelate ligase